MTAITPVQRPEFLGALSTNQDEFLSNADRIRAMSDADLARWLEYEGGGACAEVYGWLAWLQQPAEEGNNGH